MIRLRTLALLAPLLADPAQALTFDGKALLRRSAERLAQDKGGKAALQVRALVADGGALVDATGRLELSPSACEISLEGPAGRLAARWPDDTKGASALAATAALVCPLLTQAGRQGGEAEAALNKFAEAQGIALGQARLTVWQRNPAYVIGARDKSRIWLDRETLRPVRVVGKQGGQSWDVRLVGNDSVATGRRAPRLVDAFRGGERQLSLRLASVRP